MLSLKNTESNIELELSIQGYQFPEDPNDDWCLIRAIVTQNNHRFEVMDPALDTTELADLLAWFKRLAMHKLPRVAHLTFTEPCLGFEFLAYHHNLVRIAISLSNEMIPNFQLTQFGMLFPDWRIVFDLTPDDFRTIVSKLESALSEFPIRGE